LSNPENHFRGAKEPHVADSLISRTNHRHYTAVKAWLFST